MSSRLGTTLGRYRLGESIGQGGMAEVFRAVDTTLDRPVAVKVIHPDLGREPQFAERFLREAKTVAALEHPHILPIYDYGQEDGTPYLVMPFIAGGSLATLLDGRPRPLAEVVRWVDQLAAALDLAHARGVVHRDLKPANVLVGEGGERLVLSDFGIARLRDATTRLTQTGMVVGTPLYMAPEVAGGGKAGPAADLYALAVLAYEMLSGAPPFDGENLLSILHQHATRPVPPISERVERLPRQVDGILARGLAKDPADRPTTCRELAHALAAYLPTEQRPGGPAEAVVSGVASGATQAASPVGASSEAPTHLAMSATTSTTGSATATGVSPGEGGAKPQDLVPTLPLETPTRLASSSMASGAGGVPTDGLAGGSTSPGGTGGGALVAASRGRALARTVALVVASGLLAAVLVLLALRFLGPGRTTAPPPATSDRAAATPAAQAVQADPVEETAGDDEGEGSLVEAPEPPALGSATTEPSPRTQPPGPRSMGDRPVGRMSLGLRSLELRTLRRRPNAADYRQMAEMAARLEAIEGSQVAGLSLFAEGGLAVLEGDDATARQHLETLLTKPVFLRFWGPNALTLLAAGESPPAELELWQVVLAYGDPGGEVGAELDERLRHQPELAHRAEWQVGRALVHRLDGEPGLVVRRLETTFEEHDERLDPEVGAYLAVLLGDAHVDLGHATEARRWYRQGVEPESEHQGTLALMAAEGLRRVGAVSAAESYLGTACDAGHRPACEMLRRQTTGPRRPPNRGARRRD